MRLLLFLLGHRPNWFAYDALSFMLNSTDNGYQPDAIEVNTFLFIHLHFVLFFVIYINYILFNDYLKFQRMGFTAV